MVYPSTDGHPSNLGFKVTPLFDAEYLRDGTRYRHAFSGILIATNTRPILKCVISNDLE